MSSRRETTTSALGRLRAGSEAVARTLAAGRSALPDLAMGSDAEGVVHVGLDVHGDVVRLDLDPRWRETFASDALGGAVTEALRQAAEVRTGDWAAAIATANGPVVRGLPPLAVASTDEDEPGVAVEPGWAELDDETLRRMLLAAMARPATALTLPDGDRPLVVRDLEHRTHGVLSRHTQRLPSFLAAPVQTSLDTMHDGVTQALDLPLANQAVASTALGAFATRLRDSLTLATRPGGLPEASHVWTTAAIALTTSLADARAPRRTALGRLRGHAV